jgi:hypothetical protein
MWYFKQLIYKRRQNLIVDILNNKVINSKWPKLLGGYSPPALHPLLSAVPVLIKEYKTTAHECIVLWMI